MAIADIDPVAANRASVASRHQRIADRQAVAELVEPILEGFTRDEAGPKLVKMAVDLITSTVENEITPKTALEFKQLVEAAQVIHKMGRLELGESTSNTATFDVTDRDARLTELRSRLAAVEGDEGRQGEAESQ